MLSLHNMALGHCLSLMNQQVSNRNIQNTGVMFKTMLMAIRAFLKQRILNDLDTKYIYDTKHKEPHKYNSLNSAFI